MNAFTLVTALGALGAVTSYLSGMRAMLRETGRRNGTASTAWRVVFYVAVFATILAAPVSH